MCGRKLEKYPNVNQQMSRQRRAKTTTSLFPPKVSVLNFRPLNLSLTLQRINSAIESYATGTNFRILLLPLTPFNQVKRYRLRVRDLGQLRTRIAAQCA